MVVIGKILNNHKQIYCMIGVGANFHIFAIFLIIRTASTNLCQSMYS